jgi:hypothetical protein
MRTIILASLWLALSGVASSVDRQEPQESRSKETAARVIGLPRSVPGQLEFPKCTSCSARYYAIDAKTEFYIGEEKVPLEVMRAEIAARPTALALVSIAPDWRSIQTIYIVQRKPGE